MEKKHIRLYLLRAVLFLLILLTASAIFAFSAQDGEGSSQQTEKVESAISDTILPDYDPEKPSEERTWIDINLTKVLRKSAHMFVFGLLATWIYLFLLTWRADPLSHYFSALLFTLLYAISDEIHQCFVEGRSGSVTDVLIDMCGALLFTTTILLIARLVGRDRGRITCTSYSVLAPAHVPPLTLAVASDLHGRGHGETLGLLRNAAPDLILIPGDLMDDRDLEDPENGGYAFLRECAAIAPTYYSVGNHEIACYHKGNPWRHPIPVPISDGARARIADTGAMLLDNESTCHGNLRICGLTSGINQKENKANGEVLAAFAEAKEYRILLCHHPEYYAPAIRDTSIELTVCGHAHGGQWRIFGQGVYSPGQGLLPRYTSGIIDGRCIISRGIGNHTLIPRIYNSPELVLIHLESHE